MSDPIPELGRSGSVFFGDLDGDSDDESHHSEGEGICPSEHRNVDMLPDADVSASADDSVRSVTTSLPKADIEPHLASTDGYHRKGASPIGVPHTHATAPFRPSSSGSESSVEIESEEGLALVKALQEAREALDAARKHVVSPWDRPSSAAPPDTILPAEEPQIEPDIFVVEPVGAPPAPPAPPRSHVDESALPVAERNHVNLLHLRFAESAARSRVAQAQMKSKSERARQRMEALEMQARLAEDVVRGDELQMKAMQRIEVERLMEQDAQIEAERLSEDLAVERATDARVARLYAKSAARRVSSASSRRQCTAMEVCANIVSAQRQRADADKLKGAELRRRCEEADFSEVAARPGLRKKRVQSRPSRPSKSLPPRLVQRSANADNGDDAVLASSAVRLPPIGNSVHDAVSSDQRSVTPRKGAARSTCTRLPRILSAR